MATTLDILDVFGEGEKVIFAGHEWNLRFLDVADLKELQRQIGGVEKFNPSDLDHLSLIFYLFLRKSDPRLTYAQLEAEEWKLTEKQVERLLTLKRLNEPATVELLNKVLVGSGLKAEPGDSPNADGA